MKTLRLSITLIVVFVCTSLFAQNGWKKYGANSGLFTDEIVKIEIADDSSIWLATKQGLSKAKGDIIQNYFLTITNQGNNPIEDMVLANNGVWVRTNSAISYFDGSSFTTYNSNNGLIHSNIADFTVDYNDNLWIASFKGVSKFDGTQFTDWRGKFVFSIEVDSSNNIYALRFPSIDTITQATGNYNFLEYYNGTNWISDTLNNTPKEIIKSAKLERLSNGKIAIAGNGGNYITTIEFPFTISQVEFEKPITIWNNSPIVDLEIDQEGNYWLLDNNNQYNVYRIKNKTTEPILPYVGFQASNISYNSGIFGFAGNEGAYVYQGTPNPTIIQESISINNITATTKIDKTIFDASTTFDAFKFPKDFLSNAIYQANFIVTAKEPQSNLIEIYDNINSNKYKPGPIGGKDFPEKDFIVKVSRTEIERHKSAFNQTNYSIPKSIKNWPAQGDTALGESRDLAPFIDVNANGCYDPEKGDYPAIKGDEAIYWINYLIDGNLSPTFEYHYMLYAYSDSINTDINNALFLNYNIVNRSNLNYDSVKIGLFMDSDLGNSWDDYIGCDSLNNTFYTYNGNNFDNPISIGGYGDKIPALGVRYLSDSLKGFMPVFWNSLHPISNYLYLDSNWPSGQPLIYGGEGFGQGKRTKYAFTGDPISNTGWTEGNPGNGFSPNPPGDRKMVGSIPSFSLAPGERKSVDLVFGLGYDTSHTNHLLNINDMKRVLSYAKQVYDSNLISNVVLADNDDCIDTVISVQEFNNELDFNLFPNPSNGTVIIETPKSISAVFIFDITGNMIYRNQFGKVKQVRIDLAEELSAGIYFIQVVLEEKILNKKLILQH